MGGRSKSGVRFSISFQIALIFGVLTFAFVAGFSLLTTGLLRKTILQQKSDELSDNSASLCKALGESQTQQLFVETAKALQSDSASAYAALQDCYDTAGRIVRQERIPYYISYTVFYQSGEYRVILGSNDLFIPVLPANADLAPARHYEKNYYTDGDLNVLYLNAPAGELNVQTAINMDNDSLDKLLSGLPLIMLIISIPLICVSFFTARLFAARLLRPVAEITRTAREISSTHLDRRIPERGVNDELEELTHTFNQLFARLQADFDREKQFTSDVSHELRTPLAVLLGHLDLLRRWGKSDPKVLDSSLETLFSETKSMQALVENLLLLSRSERQAAPEKVIVRVEPLLKKLVADLGMISPDVKFTIKCAAEASLFTNPEILMQVLRILINNSISYSEPPADISVSFDEKSAVLTVSDKGVGIAEKDLPHIFERLYRADESRNRFTGGSGLGLAIANTLLRNLGASIAAKSAGLGQGTSMVIRFGAGGAKKPQKEPR